MKKTYQLTAANKEPARVVEAIKNEVRKYIKREKRKTLPVGMNVWNIDCKFGKDNSTPETIEFRDITKCIDEAAEQNSKSIYLELISSAIKKERKIEDVIIIEETEKELVVEETIIDKIVEENTNIEPNDKI